MDIKKKNQNKVLRLFTTLVIIGVLTTMYVLSNSHPSKTEAMDDSLIEMNDIITHEG